MTYKEIQDLIKLINKSNLSEFRLKEGEFELLIRTKDYYKSKPITQASATQQIVPIPASTPLAPAPPVSSVPAAVSAPPQQEAAQAPKKEEAAPNYIEVKSPIVGTFYRSPSPEKPPYAKVGDSISVGDVVCIIEAMKLFNEIEAEVSGKIVEVLIEDASPVEYDQPLFLVDPNG